MSDYNDIINHPHHKSKKRPPMSMYQRAAQFAPFAALSGHDAAINEVARITDNEQEMSDTASEILNRKMSTLIDHIQDHPIVSITFFDNDAKKTGGKYRIVTSTIKKIDDYNQTLIMMNNCVIPIHSIFDIQSNLFSDD